MDNMINDRPGADAQEEQVLREKFVSDYCNQKGWDKNSLTSTQLLEISSHPSYKNPLMLKS